jgi:hypothetical protein
VRPRATCLPSVPEPTLRLDRYRAASRGPRPQWAGSSGGTTIACKSVLYLNYSRAASPDRHGVLPGIIRLLEPTVRAYRAMRADSQEREYHYGSNDRFAVSKRQLSTRAIKAHGLR